MYNYWSGRPDVFVDRYVCKCGKTIGKSFRGSWKRCPKCGTVPKFDGHCDGRSRREWQIIRAMNLVLHDTVSTSGNKLWRLFALHKEYWSATNFRGNILPSSVDPVTRLRHKRMIRANKEKVIEVLSRTFPN